MSHFKPTSGVTSRSTDKATPIEWSDLSGPLTSLVDDLVAYGFLLLALPSPSTPEKHPLDAGEGELLPYLQLHRRPTDGAFVLEFSSNHFLRDPSHQLSPSTEFALIEQGWSMPEPGEPNRENFHRVATDSFGAANLIIETFQLLSLVPGQVTLLDCAVASEPTPGEQPPVPTLPDTSLFEEMLDEARYQFLESLESQGRHVSETHVSHGAPVPPNRDDHAARLLIDAGWGIVLGGSGPGFEIVGEGSPIAVLVGDDFVELTMRLPHPPAAAVREHLAAVFHALSEGARSSRHGTAFFLEEFVIAARRQIRGLQPEDLLAEVESFQFEVDQFDGRLVRMLAQLG